MVYQQQRVTIHEVARLAGVSTSTVSRALTGARPVTPEVAERVAQAARQLGYRADAVGRSLRRRETRTLGLVVADITNPFFPLVVQAVEHAAREAGFGLLLADAQNDPDIEKDIVGLLLDKRIDALLISPSHRFLSRPVIESAAAAVPVVQLDRVADEAVPFVRVDQAQAVGQLVEHFGQSNRRSLAFLGSDPSVSTSWERQEAFLRCAPELDRSATGRILVGDFSVEWGRQAARQARELWPEVDAIVCANDLIALGALQELAALGVPQGSVAVSGFDDTLIASATLLTSVRQPVAALASAAVRNAVAGVGGAVEVPSVTLSPELVVRDSTSVPAAA